MQRSKTYVHRRIAIFCLALLLPRWALSQSEFAAGEMFMEEIVLKDIPVSTAIAFAPGERIFVAVKNGLVRVAVRGELLPTPFVDISAEVNKGTDRGLLGIAVDPNFPARPFIYLSYVFDPPGSTPDSHDPRIIRVIRFSADAASNYNTAIPGSAEILLGKRSTLENMAPAIPSDAPNSPEAASCMTGLTMGGTPIEDCIPSDADSHTAGTLMFAPDGTLVASFGDGADYNRPSTLAFRSLDPDAMSGRIVRVDPDTGAGVAGNPFFDPQNPFSNRSKMWSLGLRNPFRITINPDNGQIYAGDVGSSYYEEINVGKGANFGWPCYEGGFYERSTREGPADESVRQVGFKRAAETAPTCDGWYARGQEAVAKPLFAYRHPVDATGKDLGASVTGLAFYSGDAYPTGYKGSLFFSDYAQRFIRYLTFDDKGRSTSHNFAVESSGYGAVQLLTGPDTNLYAVYIDLKKRTSEVRRFKYLGGSNSPPVARLTASAVAGDIPLTVSFSSAGSHDPDGQALTYLWDFGDGTPISADPNPVHVYTRPGTFEATLTVAEESPPFTNTLESVTVRTGVSPPVAFIDLPLSGATYQVGTPVQFAGHAASSDGSPVSLTWLILQRHNEHEHLVSEVMGASGSFVPEEHSDNTSYELCLSASAGEGLADQRCLPLQPSTSTYSVSSRPTGASITYVDDEQEFIAPITLNPIVGSTQTIAAAPFHAGRTFDHWSDGVRAIARTFTVTESSRSLTAIFTNRPPLARASVRRAPGRAVYLLDASASHDPEGSSLRYEWQFSDGTRRSGAVVSKRFPKRGTYPVLLRVRDSLGTMGSQQIRVRVR